MKFQTLNYVSGDEAELIVPANSHGDLNANLSDLQNLSDMPEVYLKSILK